MNIFKTLDNYEECLEESPAWFEDLTGNMWADYGGFHYSAGGHVLDFMYGPEWKDADTGTLYLHDALSSYGWMLTVLKPLEEKLGGSFDIGTSENSHSFCYWKDTTEQQAKEDWEGIKKTLNAALNNITEGAEPHKEIILPINLSHMSPRAIDQVVQALKEVLDKEYRIIANDVNLYVEGPIKKEMADWRDALDYERRKLREFVFDNLENTGT